MGGAEHIKRTKWKIAHAQPKHAQTSLEGTAECYTVLVHSKVFAKFRGRCRMQRKKEGEIQLSRPLNGSG